MMLQQKHSCCITAYFYDVVCKGFACDSETLTYTDRVSECGRKRERKSVRE